MVVVRTNSGGTRDRRFQIDDAVDRQCFAVNDELSRHHRNGRFVEVEVDGHDACHPRMALDRGASRPGALVVPGRRGTRGPSLASSAELRGRVPIVGSRGRCDQRVLPLRMDLMTGTFSETGSACHCTKGHADDDSCEDEPGERSGDSRRDTRPSIAESNDSKARRPKCAVRGGHRWQTLAGPAFGSAAVQSPTAPAARTGLGPQAVSYMS